MIVRAQCEIPLPARRVFDLERDPAVLIALARPALRIAYQSPPPERWSAGDEISIHSSLFGFWPQDPHRIRFVRIDADSGVIETDESGGPITRWRHRVTISPTGADHCLYRDHVEIAAGWRTPLVWLGAQVFYRWRQRRWRRYARALRD